MKSFSKPPIKKNIGHLIRVIGPVVDVKFQINHIPRINNCLLIKRKSVPNVVLEVAQHIGDEVVRCISMHITDGLKRGDEVLDTGSQITVPVGKEILGRMLNVTGEFIDEKPAVKTLTK